MKKRQCVRNHRSHKREDCATGAKAGGEASLDLGVTLNEREPHGTCQRAGNITGPVDSAKRGALVREYHRPRNRPRALRRSASVKGATGRTSDECAIRASAEEG